MSDRGNSCVFNVLNTVYEFKKRKKDVNVIKRTILASINFFKYKMCLGVLIDFYR